MCSVDSALAISRGHFQLDGSNLRQPTCGNLEFGGDQCRHHLRLPAAAETPPRQIPPEGIYIPTPQPILSAQLPSDIWKQRRQQGREQSAAHKRELCIECDETLERLTRGRTRHPGRHRHTHQGGGVPKRAGGCMEDTIIPTALGRELIKQGHRNRQHLGDAG